MEAPSSRIEPELLKGFRDFLPEEMISLENLLDVVRRVYRGYGFRPQDTPALEQECILTGQTTAGETGKQIYTFLDRDRLPVGMRFDLTVPLSRVVAANAKTLRFPYKRYQYSRVWRFDKVKPGRYREFGQFDADIVGSTSVKADAEICCIIHDAVASVGFSHFVVRINNRKILNALAEVAGLDSREKSNQLFRELDKMDKQGWKTVRQNLAQKKRLAGEEAEGEPLGLGQNALDQIESFISISSVVQMDAAEEGRIAVPQFTPNTQVIEQLATFFHNSPLGQEGCAELRQILETIRTSGFAEERFQLDLNIARGLDYYTGPIFETTLLDYPSYGSVFSGGRYDRLIGRFLDYEVFFREFPEYREAWRDKATGQPIVPATGASLGVDRVFAILKELSLVQERHTLAEVLVVTMSEALFGECQKIAQELRQSGICTDLYTGEAKSIRHQLRYADRLAIPLAVFYGEDEQKNGLVTIKNLRKGREDQTKQLQCPRSQVALEVKRLLALT